MSRKRKHKAVEAVPDEVLAEGSGPVSSVVQGGVEVEVVAAAAEVEVAAAAEVAVEAAEVAAECGEAAGAVDAGSFDGIASTDDSGDDGVEPGMADAPRDEADGSRFGDGAEAEAEADVAADGVAVGEGEGEGDGEREGELELGATLPTSAASMDAAQLKYLVEALVFASDKPLTVPRLRQLTRVSDTRRLEQALADLAEDYRERGLVLQQVSGGYQFRTRTQFSGWVQQLIAGRPVRLSRAQLETLAIIAYRQPITRPEIDNIRGVDSSATLKLLIDRALVRILGKKEEVGRPMLYGTTKEFLDFFSLGDLRELPTLREYSELTDESRKVMSDRLGLDPSETPSTTDAAAGAAAAAADDDPDDGSGEGGGGGGGGGGDGSSGDGMPPMDYGSSGEGEAGADVNMASDASVSDVSDVSVSDVSDELFGSDASIDFSGDLSGDLPEDPPEADADPLIPNAVMASDDSQSAVDPSIEPSAE